MIYRLHLKDWLVIGHYLGALILIIAASMIAPFVVALLLGELSAAVDFLYSIGIALIIGSLLLLCRVHKGPLDWHQALVITGMCWIVLSFFGAVPLWLSGHYSSFLDAFFETVSCFTTTGISVTLDLDHMPLSVIMWRSVMNLLGGVGVVVVALALGIFGTGAAAATLYHDEARGDRVMPEIKQTARFILKVTGIVVASGTIACTIPCLLIGIEPTRAVLHGFFLTASDYTTGGMTAQSAGMMYYHCWPLEIITMVIMFFSGLNFLLYNDLWNGRLGSFFKDIEVRTIGIWITILVVLIMFAMMAGSYYTDLGSMLRRGLYEIMSAALNIGYSTFYPGQMLYGVGTGVLFVTILGMTIGASASSISGGIKALRIGIIARSITQTVRTALAPDKARPRTFFYHRGRQLLTPELVSSAMTIMLLYIATYAVGAVIGVMHGYDALPSIFESVSAASNTGLSSGITQASMPNTLKITYIIEMWLGRLEFIAIFAMFLQFFTALVTNFQSRKGRAGLLERIRRHRGQL